MITLSLLCLLWITTVIGCPKPTTFKSESVLKQICETQKGRCTTYSSDDYKDSGVVITDAKKVVAIKTKTVPKLTQYQYDALVALIFLSSDKDFISSALSKKVTEGKALTQSDFDTYDKFLTQQTKKLLFELYTKKDPNCPPVQPKPSSVIKPVKTSESKTKSECKGKPIACPLAECVVTSPFGPRNYGGSTYHYGTDYRASVGTNVLAVSDGEIKYSGYHIGTSGRGWGTYMAVLHDDGGITLYAHLKTRNKKVKEKVKRGDVIATSGKSGTDAPHLHLEYIPDTATNKKIISRTSNTFKIDPDACIIRGGSKAVQSEYAVMYGGGMYYGGDEVYGGMYDYDDDAMFEDAYYDEGYYDEGYYDEGYDMNGYEGYYDDMGYYEGGYYGDDYYDEGYYDDDGYYNYNDNYYYYYDDDDDISDFDQLGKELDEEINELHRLKKIYLQLSKHKDEFKK